MRSPSLQYANALADVALAQGAGQSVTQQLGDFVAACRESAELRNILSSPAVTKEQKRAVAEKIAARLGASQILRNFLFVVIDHQRTRLFPEILVEFQNVLRERQGVAQAEVFSAVSLDDVQKKALASSLEQVTGKKIEAKFSVDPSLLGGARVRVGDTVYDDSLRNRLAEMRERLAAES